MLPNTIINYNIMLITNYQFHLFALTFTRSYVTSKRRSLRIRCTAVDYFRRYLPYFFRILPRGGET